MLERLFALETLGIKLGLDNIARLCEALGHPERTFTSIHVAGTNGKGSVTAMVHAGLLESGVRAARYTSPHLTDISERFVIGSEPVSAAELERAADDVLACADGLRANGVLPVLPTFFEASTAIAFELFRRRGVDAAVIEVGLGGRFDATNVLTAPVGAVTSIGFDHQQYLGHSLDAIAFEKAGILKPGMTVVVGELPPQAAAVIGTVAAQRGARLVRAAEATHVDVSMSAGRATLTIDTPVDRYGPLTLALRGEHQIGNAVVAVRLLEAARDVGVAVRADGIEQGLSAARWPGRLELVDVGDGRQVLIDAAHNVDGARALAAYLSRWHPDPPALMIGVSRDKDLDGILGALLPVTATIVATEAGTTRARPADEIAARVRHLDSSRAVATLPGPAEALEEAWRHARVVCVAGSIFLAGAVRDVLRQRGILR